MKENQPEKSRAEVYAYFLGYGYEQGMGQGLLSEALINRILSDPKLLNSFIEGAQKADAENWEKILSEDNKAKKD